MTVYDFTRIGDVLDALYATLSGPAGERDWDVRHQSRGQAHPHRRRRRKRRLMVEDHEPR